MFSRLNISDKIQLWILLAASVTAVATISIAVYGFVTIERSNCIRRAESLPILRVSPIENDIGGYEFVVQAGGRVPAIIQSVHTFVDENETDWGEIIYGLSRANIAREGGLEQDLSSRTIHPSQTLILSSISRIQEPEQLRNFIRDRLDLTVYYCSFWNEIYGRRCLSGCTGRDCESLIDTIETDSLPGRCREYLGVS